eukprot:GEMP01134041.1.p1 GENE.GEMP01134041.1~~GEMP01134041.1.p1  ORF type:complete len:153 (+),score=20.09 GEMP01134041.1:1-459(+)
MADRKTSIKQLGELLADTNLEDPEDILVMYVKPEDDKKKGMIAIEHRNNVKEEDFEEYYNNLTTQLLQGVPEENHLLYRYRAHELYRKLTNDKGGDLEEVGEYKWARGDYNSYTSGVGEAVLASCEKRYVGLVVRHGKGAGEPGRYVFFCIL